MKTSDHGWRFDSIEDMLATIATDPWEGKESTSNQTNEEGGYAHRWQDSLTYAEAIQRATYGCPALLAKFEERRQLTVAPGAMRSITPQPVMAEEGDEVMVDRFLAGESDCWLSFPMVETPKAGKIVTLVVQVGGKESITAEDFICRGVAALTLIDALESAGYRVEVWAGTASKKSGGINHSFTVCLKRPQDGLDLDRLAFWLCSAAVMRRFSFRLRELSGFSPGLSAMGGTFVMGEDLRPGGAESIFLPPAEPNKKGEAYAKDIRAILDTFTGTA